jgi:dienelactone hydrolase
MKLEWQKVVWISMSICLVSAEGYAQTVFPEVTGPYKVGHADIEMIDDSRLETLTEDPEDKRRLLVSLYYPAAVSADAIPAPYVTAALGAALRVPPQFQNQAAMGYTNVPFADGAFPVLVFSPAAGNITHYYSSLLHQVASQGYVVAAIWHTYTTRLTLFPDGTLLASNAAGSVSGDTREKQIASITSIGGVWVEDQRFVLTQLTIRNDSDPLLADHLDLAKVGTFGHSLGGAVALESAYQDDRFDAALNMDGTMFGSATTAGSRVPFLFLRSAPVLTDEELIAAGTNRGDYEINRKVELDSITQVISNSDVASIIEFENARHNAFTTDNIFFSASMSPEQKANLIGTIDPKDAFEKVVTWVVDFMAIHVK